MSDIHIIEEFNLHSVSLVDYPPHPACRIEVINSERGSSFMLETTKYIRKPFVIEAVRVTAANIKEIAKWVDGEIKNDKLGDHVKVRVNRPANDRQTKAYVGDWVLYAGTGFKVYADKAFRNSFDQVSEETTMIDVDAAKKKSNKPAASNDEIVGVVEGDVVVPKRVPRKTVAKASA